MKQNKIENKIITGGMIPKIESAIQTLESGVESILLQIIYKKEQS